MKVLKKSEQRNFIIDRDMYTESKIKEMFIRTTLAKVVEYLRNKGLI